MVLGRLVARTSLLIFFRASGRAHARRMRCMPGFGVLAVELVATCPAQSCQHNQPGSLFDSCALLSALRRLAWPPQPGQGADALLFGSGATFCIVRKSFAREPGVVQLRPLMGGVGIAEVSTLRTGRHIQGVRYDRCGVASGRRAYSGASGACGQRFGRRRPRLGRSQRTRGSVALSRCWFVVVARWFRPRRQPKGHRESAARTQPMHACSLLPEC